MPLARNFCRRDPEKNLLHQLVCAHLDTLLAERRADDPDGHGLPTYVEQEFRRFIDCGVACRGFVRVVCDRCKREMVVGFSCKGMGFCPSCLGRRMNDTAAQLVDRVLPFSPYRQWVLSLPFRLRLLLAKEGTLLGKVRTIFTRTVRSWQRLQARRLGLRDAQTAAVCFTQLFGSRLDCSPHFHALAPDAVFLDSEEGDIELWRLPQPTREEVAKLVERIARRTLAMLKKEVGEDLRLNALDRLRAVTHQQLSFSAMAEPPEEREGKLSARCEGFSLQAGRHLHERDREGLEATATGPYESRLRNTRYQTTIRRLEFLPPNSSTLARTTLPRTSPTRTEASPSPAVDGLVSTLPAPPERPCPCRAAWPLASFHLAWGLGATWLTG